MLNLLLVGALALHGGQYLQPLQDPETEKEDDKPKAEEVVTHPGSGPILAFAPGRWEWWFEFNEEDILGLRARLALDGGEAFATVTDGDRLRGALPVLVDSLRAESRDERAAAVMSLGRLGLPAVVPYVEVMLEDNDLFVRTQAVLAMGATGQGAAVEPLSRILSDEKSAEELRCFAAESLGLIADDEAVDVLRSRLGDKLLSKTGNQLRISLLHAAGVARHPALVPALLALDGTWLMQNDADVRALVTQSLGQIGSADGLPFVLARLDDQDNQVRRSAAAALEGLASRLDDVQVTRVLTQLDRENDIPARYALVRALGLARRPASREALRRVLSSGTALVRPHAAIALGLDGDPDNAGVLLEVLADQHELSNRTAIVTALGLLGAGEATPILSGLLQREREPSMLASLCLALGLIGGLDAPVVDRIEVLAGTSHDPELVRWAIVALGLLGERPRLAALADGIGTLRGTVDRAARVYALGLVGDRSTLSRLAGVARDESEPSYVVTYALGALGDLCDPTGRKPSSRFSRHVALDHDVGFLMELYRMP